MSKGVATNWKIVVNNVDLSRWGFDVQIEDSREKVDISTFNPTRTKEYAPGSRDQTVTVSFLQDRAAGGPFQTIRPLYEGGSAFPFYVVPNASLGTAADNMLYGGTASCYSFPNSATLDEREEVEIEFSPASGATFAYGTIAP